MHARGLELSDAVNRERALVRDDGSAPRPERPADQVVVYVGYPLREAEEAAVDAQPVAGANVVGLRRVGVADLLGLGRGEVAALVGRQAEQSSS